MRHLSLILLFSLFATFSLYSAGTVTIKGKVRAYKEFPFKTDRDQVTVTSFDPYISIYKASVDPEGNFKLCFPKGFTGDVEFKFADNSPILVMVSPGDRQYYLVAPMAIKTIVSFSGDNAATNQQIADYIKARSEAWLVDGKQERRFNMLELGISQILETPVTFERKKAFLETYIKENQLSPLFVKWARTDVNYNYAARRFHLMTNQHQPISDPSFFRQFPIDDAESLVAISYLTYLQVVRSSAIYWSPQINTLVVYPDSVKGTESYKGRDAKHREAFDAMLKYSNLSVPEMTANLNYPDSIEKYTTSQDDRFTVDYINRKTSGPARDFLFASYVLDELKREERIGESGRAPMAYRYPRLIVAYKKSVPNGRYLSTLKAAYKTFASTPKKSYSTGM